MASVGSIVGGAFRLLVERPGAVIVWMLVYFAGALGIALLMGLIMTGTLTFFPGPAFTAQQDNLPPGMWQAILVVGIGWAVLGSVLMNAVFRAVLRPEARSFASLRLGMDELRTIGLGLVLFVLAFLAMLISQLLMMFIAAFVRFAAGETAGGLIILALTLAFFGALIWIYVRLSALFPLTLYRRKISLDAAWDLTRGRFWTLFGAYLVVGLVMLVLGAAITWATTGDYFAAMWAARGDPAQMAAAAAEFAQRQLEMPATTRIVHMVLGTLTGAIGLALGPGVIASATRELLIERGEGDADEAGNGVPEQD